jgi:hypothetical protein
MKMIGKTLVELGVVSILYGKLGFAIKFFAKNPLAAIAVGAALIALGNTLGAQAARISSAGLSGEGGGGGGGGYSASASGGSGSSDQGPTTLVIRFESDSGIVDLRDPKNQVVFAQLFEDLTGRQVIVEPKGWGSNGG